VRSILTSRQLETHRYFQLHPFHLEQLQGYVHPHELPLRGFLGQVYVSICVLLVNPCADSISFYSLSNMNGNLNSTLQQIAQGSSSAAPSGAAPSGSAVGAPSGSAPTATVNPSGSASHSSSPSGSHSASTSAKPTGAAQAAGASGLFASAGLVATVASIVGSFML
jgi:hypothetical protein